MPSHLTHSPAHDFHNRRGRWIAATLVPAWLALLVIGYVGSVNFENRPGESAEPPRMWPAGTRLSLAPDGPTVVMFLHPECPCSRASVTELANLVDANPQVARVHVVLVSAGDGHDARASVIARDLEAFNRAEITLDDHAELAHAFGSRTSGDALIFSPAGSLLFCGGLTVARGHVGAGRSSELAAKALRGMMTDPAETPVFGCPLF